MSESKWRARIKAEMLRQGYNPKTLSLKAGKNETFVRDLFESSAGPKIENFLALTHALGLKAGEILDEEPAPVNAIVDDLEKRFAEVLTTLRRGRTPYHAWSKAAVRAVEAVLASHEIELPKPDNDLPSPPAGPKEVGRLPRGRSRKT